MELEANPDYYAGPPAIDRVIFRFDPAWQVFDSVRGDIDAFEAPVFLTPDFLANNPDYGA